MDALTMEAYACKDGMILAKRNGIDRLCLETDCHELVTLWEQKDGGRSVISPIIMEIQELSVCFQGFSLSYVSRICKKVAHEVTKQVCGRETVVWQEGLLCIHCLLAADCNVAP
jgi:hypothetical protein